MEIGNFLFHYIDGRPRLVGSVSFFNSVDGSVHEILGPSPKRRCIVWAANFINAGNILVSPHPLTLGSGGFNVVAGQPPLVMRYEDFGTLIQGTWDSQAVAAGQQVTIIEVLEADYQIPEDE